MGGGENLRYNNSQQAPAASSFLSPSSSGIPRYKPSTQVVTLTPDRRNNNHDLTPSTPGYNRSTTTTATTTKKATFVTPAAATRKSNLHAASSLKQQQQQQQPKYVDRGLEGVQTKSCLTFRPRNETTGIHMNHKKTPNSANSSSNSKGHSMSNSRFGWGTTRRANHNKSLYSTGGVTSQESSSHNLVDVDENDSNSYAPISSWAEGSLSISSQHGRDPGSTNGSATTTKTFNNSTIRAATRMTKKQQQLHLKQQQQQQQGNNNKVQPTTILDLLTPPMVEDRGSDPHKIQQYDKMKKLRNRRRGLYDGEIEPDGVRGQEAKVPKKTARTTNGNNVPTLSQNVANNTNFHIISPVSKQSNVTIDSLSPIHAVVSVGSEDDEMDDDDDYPTTSRIVTPSGKGRKSSFSSEEKDLQSMVKPKVLLPNTQHRQLRFQGTNDDHIRSNYVNNSMKRKSATSTLRLLSTESENDDEIFQRSDSQSNSDSTGSDENLKGLLPDLLPTPFKGDQVPNILHSPSALGLPTSNEVSQNSRDDTDRMRFVRSQESGDDQSAVDRANSVDRDIDIPMNGATQLPPNSSQNSQNLGSNNSRTSLDPYSYDANAQTSSRNEEAQSSKMSRNELKPQNGMKNHLSRNVKSKFVTDQRDMSNDELLKIEKQSSAGTSTTTEETPDSPIGTSQQEKQIDTFNCLAMEHVNNGQYDDALKLFTRVLDIQNAIHGYNTPNPGSASSYHNLGTVHAKRAQSLEGALSSASSPDSPSRQLKDRFISDQVSQARTQAFQCFQAAARSARDSLGKNHPNVAVSLVRVGFLLLNTKQYKNADVTFTEALRIRLEHYGSDHPLVANLYNNIGVCKMHLHQFNTGLIALYKALHIQQRALEAKGVVNDEMNRKVQVLELSDTLFNVGGLCLEWIREEQDDCITIKADENSDILECNALHGKWRSDVALECFEEALRIRLQCYDQDARHPAVQQVQSLLITAKQYSLIKHQNQKTKLLKPGGIETSSSTSSSRSGGIKNLLTPRGRTPQPQLGPTSANNANANTSSAASTPRIPEENSPPTSSQRSGHMNLTSSSKLKGSQKDIPFSSSSDKARNLNGSHSEEGGELAQPHSQVRRLRHDQRNALDEDFKSIYESQLAKKSSAATSPRKHQNDESALSKIDSADQHDVFRADGIDQNPTVLHDSFCSVGSGSNLTRIYVTPHEVPRVSATQKQKSPGSNNSQLKAFNSMSLEHDTFEEDLSSDVVNNEALDNVEPLLHKRISKSRSYDAEENCLISNSGADSNNGRIHYPLTWNKAGVNLSAIVASHDEFSGDENDDHFADVSSRDIIVTQPFRKSLQVSPSVENRSRSGNKLASDALSENNSSHHWGSETVNFSTGNVERDDLMARARAILNMHNLEESDSDDSDNDSFENDPGDIPMDNDVQMTNVAYNEEKRTETVVSASSLETDPFEDGIAPLGDTGFSQRTNMTRRQRDMKELLEDPMSWLPELHAEASKQLHNNNINDAIHLFEIILRCQRRKYGALHQDVASALHNVGIAQLRAQNHTEALKAFEEAARVRKGSLGKDHPLVAVSLVKVGITLLLLHRFEEALWSFREALSVRKHSLGELHPSTARIYNNIGCVYVEFNEFRQARRAFEAALDTQRNALVHDPTSGPLMFGTATTLCNLGYLYRFRDMHEKATSVLKEASELQETVLGKFHATVLSTLDNLADSCANSGNGNDALKYYNIVLERFRSNGLTGKNTGSKKKVARAEAVLLYKMSRVHRLRNDRENQLNTLQQALDAISIFNGSDHEIVKQPNQLDVGKVTDSLERRIHTDILTCRELIEKEELKWI